MPIVHYDVTEQLVGQALLVRLNVYNDTDSKLGPPLPPALVRVSPEGIPYFRMPPDTRESWGHWYVRPPGRLARLFGATFEQRLGRARRKAHRLGEKEKAKGLALYRHWKELQGAR